MFEVVQLSSYQPPRDALHLQRNQIHVWFAILSEFTPDPQPLHMQLSSDERAQAERFRFPKDRDHFVARRGILRNILSCYLQQHPSDIVFCQGQFGKPEIKDDFVRGGLQFSVSHSGDLALYAVTRERPIGIDIEYVRPVPDFEEIASQFFSRRESEALMALPPEDRREVFFGYWTCKEALLKATGVGIGEGLATLEVIPTRRGQAETLEVHGESRVQSEWQVRSFSPAPGYLAAVAFARSDVV